MTASHVLGIDSGTTRTTVIVVDESGAIVSSVGRAMYQQFPRPGWVEQDPHEIWRTAGELAREAVQRADLAPSDIGAVGITNQRETTIVWERSTGRAVTNAIVWQDRRSSDICAGLKQAGLAEFISDRTGLVIDPYFSATKLAWLFANEPNLAVRAARGELCFGTVDTWLVWNFTAEHVHATDVTNASRTLLMDLERRQYDDELLDCFGVDVAILPEIVPSQSIFGELSSEVLGVANIPIAGVLGDQQASLFAQACHRAGDTKVTYGTGSFVLCNTGTTRPRQGDLLTTVALSDKEHATYALEGSIFATGAAIQWLRDGLGLIEDPAETASLAASLKDNGDVWFVPALAGLGAPFWDPDARGTLIGLTSATTRAHVARAVLESIAFRTCDVLQAITGLGRPVRELRVDGGAAVNSWLMQFQADLAGVPVDVAAVTETTVLGAAYLAGLSIGIWKDRAQVEDFRRSAHRYLPRLENGKRERLYARWRQALDRSRDWAN